MKSSRVAAFFDGESLRVANVSSDEAREVRDERSYVVADYADGNIWPEVRKDFGNNLHLVVSESCLYTFSVDIPKNAGGPRKNISIALRDFFPEDSTETVWDYRVIQEKDGLVSLEVTELKRPVREMLSLARGCGIVFGSVIPESIALARVLAKPSPTLIAHRKSEDSFLLLCCEAGVVYASFFLKKPFLASDVVTFSEYCEKKKGKKMTSAYVSGFSAEDFRECAMTTEVASAPMDPILGADDRDLWRGDANALDLSLSLQEMSRFRRNLVYCYGEMLNRWNNVSFMKKTSARGFTLLEILIAVGIIALLATIIVIALDPAERFRNARESRRLSDIQTISNAVHQYLIDKKGVFPPGIDEQERQLGTASSGCALENSICHVKGSSDCIDLSASLKSYLTSIPEDPETGSAELTHYTIEREKKGNRIIVRACDSTENYVVQ